MTSAGVPPAATGLGPWPGTDGSEAARTVVGELGVLPHLAELPARGVGADQIGRTAALLVDLPVDASPAGYRLSDAPGRVLRAGRAHLARDLDFAEEAFERAGLRGAGGAMKLQAAGPITLAAEVGLRTGRRAVTDRGAARDLAESLAEGVRAHVGKVRSRFGCRPVLQLDEPRLPAALAGVIPGPTRYDPVRAVPREEAEALLSRVVEAAGDVPVIFNGPDLHDAPLGLLDRLGVAAVALPLCGTDADRDLRAEDLDAVGEWLDSGRSVALGLVPAVRPVGPAPDWHALARPALDLVDRLGMARTILTRQALVTPETGLAGADPRWARTALGLAKSIAAAFASEPGDL